MINVTKGVKKRAQKVVIYGPEGVGKSTFASQSPTPLFIDTEGGTDQLDIARLDAPSSWTMLLDEVKDVAYEPGGYGTLVIDTADWAEKLCIEHVISTAGNGKITGIEDFGYGKGYTYVKEEFGRLLNLLGDVIDAGINVVVTAHAAMRKFEQPDELGAYDRWELKLSKQVSPMLKEWADMVLFANYKPVVMTDQNGKSKAQGNKRVMYTNHHACWDAKNRVGLADELPFDYKLIEPYIPVTGKTSSQGNEEIKAAKPAKTADAPAHAVDVSKIKFTEVDPDYLKPLRDLMRRDGISDVALRDAVASQGYRTIDTPITLYPDDLVKRLISAWGPVTDVINERSLYGTDIPF